MARKRITVGKYMGDDLYSWAVFLDGRPVVTGLSRGEVPYHRKHIEGLVAAREGVGSALTAGLASALTPRKLK